MKKMTIIGGGIGGLTTALALQKSGFEVEIFDKAEKLFPVGAGLFLASNAMQIFVELGLKESIEVAGHTVSNLIISKPCLKPITTMDLSYFENKYKVRNVAIHRHVLQDILLNSLKSDTKIHFNHELKSIEKEGDHYQLLFKNGNRVKSDFVIGADGIHSKVRKYVLKEDCIIRNANQICWRGVVDYKLPDIYQHKMVEMWGKGKRFGFSQISANTVYWFALVNDGMEDKATLLEHFKDFDVLIGKLIESAHNSGIHKDGIYDLTPLNYWANEGLCLIGDAAHATTPNLGQGACQAIEDGFYIAKFLSKYEPELAFKKFEDFRKDKVNRIVKTSWTLGKIAQSSNPIIRSIRNIALKNTPAKVNQKQSEAIFNLKSME